jgi:hypothetical protein
MRDEGRQDTFMRDINADHQRSVMAQAEHPLAVSTPLSDGSLVLTSG